MPEAAGITPTPCGPSITIWSKVRSPDNTWCRSNSGLSPKVISTLARPRSPSQTRTFLPVAASATARFTVRLVLPTPPLPLDTATTLPDITFLPFFRCLSIRQSLARIGLDWRPDRSVVPPANSPRASRMLPDPYCAAQSQGPDYQPPDSKANAA